MRLSKTYDFIDETDPIPRYLPWPRVTKPPGRWHGNLPFFRELQDDVRRVEKFVNLSGLCDRLGGLFKCPEDCEYKGDSGDSEYDSSVHDESWDCSARNYRPPGTMELEDREFIMLDQWIPRMSEAVQKLSGIRDKMIARSSLSKKNFRERLSFLDDETRQRILKKLPPGIDFPFLNDYLHCSDDDESGSDDTDDPGNSISKDSHRMMSERSIAKRSERGGVHLGTLLRDLPGEILHDVIVKAQPSSPHIQFTLSHVNHFFRTFVITSPLLWSKVNFWYPLSMTSLYLVRSAEAGLDVVADRGEAPSPTPVIAAKEQTKAKAFYKLLRPHRHRIRSLRVRGFTSLSWEAENQDGDQAPQTEGVPDHFLWSPLLCSLEYLDLGFTTWEGKEFPGLPVITNLRELRLSGPCTPSIFSLISNSLKHLTLNIPQLTLPVLKNILSSTPSLESLTFSTVHLQPPSDISDYPVDFQSLKSLSINGSPPETIHRLLQLIACPNLQDLHLHLTGKQNPAYHSESNFYRIFHPVDATQLQLFHKPQYQIQKLDIVSCEADPVVLETTLDSLPGLKHLRIASAALTNAHLEVLVVKAPSDGASAGIIRCPHLTSLILDNEHTVSSIVVRRIVQSRKDASIPLRSVTLCGFDVLRVFSEDLDVIRKSGVDLTVSVLAEHEVVESDDSDWSSSWSGEEDLEDELASGDEEVLDR